MWAWYKYHAMFSYTPQMRKWDEVFRATHGGLREWFLAPENRGRRPEDLAEELNCDQATLYNYMSRLALERRARIVDLQAVEA